MEFELPLGQPSQGEGLCWSYRLNAIGVEEIVRGTCDVRAENRGKSRIPGTLLSMYDVPG